MVIYELIEPHSADYAICISTLNYINPIDYLKRIKNELNARGISGIILFDLLACNGNASNRFVSVQFDSKTFIFETWKVVSMEENPLQYYNSFYRNRDSEASVYDFADLNLNESKSKD